MKHTAIGIFQGDADWSVKVKVAGFASLQEAEGYANDFRILLREGRLFRDYADGASTDDKEWIELKDAEVYLTRLKPQARERLERARQRYQQMGMDQTAIATHSMNEFLEGGNNDLFTCSSFDLI